MLSILLIGETGMEHFLTVQDYSKKELLDLIDLAFKMKSSKALYYDALKNKKLGLIFEKSSTRTRVSFEAGMQENVILNRLYEEKIKGDEFSEAENILWQVKELSKSNTEIIYEIISSEFWLENLEDKKSYEAQTHAEHVQDGE